MTDTTAPSGKVDARTLAIEAARLMDDLKCEQVLVLDVHGLSQITDFVVIGTGTSNRQMLSVGDDVAEMGESVGHEAFRVSQQRSDDWAIVDFVDVTVHLFEPNARAYYDLETLWGDAREVEWQRPNGRNTPPGLRFDFKDDS